MGVQRQDTIAPHEPEGDTHTTILKGHVLKDRYRIPEEVRFLSLKVKTAAQSGRHQFRSQDPGVKNKYPRGWVLPRCLLQPLNQP